METEEVAPSTGMVATSDLIRKASKGANVTQPDQNVDLVNIPGVDTTRQPTSSRLNNPLLAFQENPYFDATHTSAAPMNPMFEQIQGNKSTIENSIDAAVGQSFDLYINASVTGRKGDKLGAYVRAQTQSDYRNQNKLQMNVNMRTLHRLKLQKRLSEAKRANRDQSEIRAIAIQKNNQQQMRSQTAMNKGPALHRKFSKTGRQGAQRGRGESLTHR